MNETKTVIQINSPQLIQRLNELFERKDAEKAKMSEQGTAPKKKVAKKAAAKAPEATAKKGAEKKEAPKKEVEKSEGVTPADLGKEFDLESRVIRMILRANDVDRPEGGRWSWKEGSKELANIRKMIQKEKDKPKEA